MRVLVFIAKLLRIICQLKHTFVRRMEYALYKGLKSSAQPKLKGTCVHCSAEVLAKCGSKNIWHWAHLSKENCDPWFEGETPWHRDWKNLFGADCSEIRLIKEKDYHIADVINKNGIVFEFQNSSISAEDILKREEFYGKKMMWVINGSSFKESFQIRDDEFLKEWIFILVNEFDTAQHYPEFANAVIIEDWSVKNHHVKELLVHHGFMYAPGEKIYYKNHTNKFMIGEKIIPDLLQLYKIHRRIETPVALGAKKGEFTWDHSRRSWQDAKRPVFIDFGEDFLYRVTSNMGKKHGEGIKIGKGRFIEKYCT